VKRTPGSLHRTSAVGVVLPVHNEEELVLLALTSLEDSFRELLDWEIDLRIVVVLDSCTDHSATVIQQWVRMQRLKKLALTTKIITCDARNVGIARRLGCAMLLEELHSFDPEKIWIATTDADSTTPIDWLRMQVLQHELGVELWCGRVSVNDWSSRDSKTAAQWQREYDVETHPIHGTNLGFNARAYLNAGGFNPSRASEDRELCAAIEASGAFVYYDSTVRVITSARRDARAPMGFAHELNRVEASLGFGLSN
jgi:glycosyltransferase involved in cell wall biosynthesis